MSKRALTEDTYKAGVVSRTGHSSLLADDITTRLQNIGSRVRKSVTEGYMTPHSTVPNTPHSSPMKPSANVTPLFRSARATVRDVFSSPTRASASPSVSPLKRGRVDLKDDDDDEKEGEVDPDEVTFTLEPQAARPVKPLRKSSRSSPPMLRALQPTSSMESVDSTTSTTSFDVNMEDVWKQSDMFNHPF